jgi:hypothetical protein
MTFLSSEGWDDGRPPRIFERGLIREIAMTLGRIEEVLQVK